MLLNTTNYKHWTWLSYTDYSRCNNMNRVVNLQPTWIELGMQVHVFGERGKSGMT